MENVTYITDEFDVEHAIVQHADGSFTSMLKSTYDAQEAAKNDLS